VCSFSSWGVLPVAPPTLPQNASPPSHTCPTASVSLSFPSSASVSVHTVPASHPTLPSPTLSPAVPLPPSQPLLRQGLRYLTADVCATYQHLCITYVCAYVCMHAFKQLCASLCFFLPFTHPLPPSLPPSLHPFLPPSSPPPPHTIIPQGRRRQFRGSRRRVGE
jgi:hypothetical protein